MGLAVGIVRDVFRAGGGPVLTGPIWGAVGDPSPGGGTLGGGIHWHDARGGYSQEKYSGCIRMLQIMKKPSCMSDTDREVGAAYGGVHRAGPGADGVGTAGNEEARAAAASEVIASLAKSVECNRVADGWNDTWAWTRSGRLQFRV
jgi:hypothetical protein